jgi:hypothetical protein
VLVRGGMKNNRGAVTLEYLSHPVEVTDIGDYARCSKLVFSNELLFDLEDRILAVAQ